MSNRLLMWGVIIFALAGPAEQGDLNRFQKVVDPLVQAVRDRDYEAARKDFNEGMREALPPGETRAFFEGLRQEQGTIEEMGQGEFVPPHTAVFPLTFSGGGKMELTVVLDSAGKITGLWIRPPSPEIPVPERNQTELSLPLSGWWHVAWGGDTEEQNQHHDTRSQRYAFDFLGVDRDGSRHTGSGRRNEDYYAFGRKVLAPAPGVVTEVIRGVHDSEPGTMNPYSALGNAVFIRHREHEVSVLAHLKQGSIRVKRGQRVRRGQVLALCGNSGNSSEPHLHYHLQNTPRIEDATGVKCFFRNVGVRKDHGVERLDSYSPVKGEVIAPAARAGRPARVAD